MALSFRRLELILQAIRRHLPGVQRVSSYCLPRNLRNKSVEQLAALRNLGLELFYVGCESGDDFVLERVSKGETFASSLAALRKIKAAGAKSSVMILNGMGGRRFSEQHARNSAQLMNEAQPDYLSGLFREMQLLLTALELQNTIFRSDHASNYLVLKGTLNRDRPRLLATVQAALERPGAVPLRPEWARGL